MTILKHHINMTRSHRSASAASCAGAYIKILCFVPVTISVRVMYCKCVHTRILGFVHMTMSVRIACYVPQMCTHHNFVFCIYHNFCAYFITYYVPQMCTDHNFAFGIYQKICAYYVLRTANEYASQFCVL